MRIIYQFVCISDQFVRITYQFVRIIYQFVRNFYQFVRDYGKFDRLAVQVSRWFGGYSRATTDFTDDECCTHSDLLGMIFDMFPDMPCMKRVYRGK